MVVLEAVLTILVLDFTSGLVHWVEDTFWTEETPIVGRWIVQPNVLHHHDGSAFLRNNWLQSSWDLMVAGMLIVLAAWGLGVLTWHVWLFVILGTNANQIHKWSHMGPTQVPYIIRLLQRCRVLQSGTDHALHHRGEKNSAYCVITPFTNTVLDRIGFWRGLERLLVSRKACPRRDDLMASN